MRAMAVEGCLGVMVRDSAPPLSKFLVLDLGLEVGVEKPGWERMIVVWAGEMVWWVKRED